MPCMSKMSVFRLTSLLLNLFLVIPASASWKFMPMLVHHLAKRGGLWGEGSFFKNTSRTLFRSSVGVWAFSLSGYFSCFVGKTKPCAAQHSLETV